MFPGNYFKIDPLISRAENRAEVDKFCYTGKMLECMFSCIVRKGVLC